MFDTQSKFVILTNEGIVKMRGRTTSLEFIEANLEPGDTYHWGDDIAIELCKDFV